jgi:hypothetical protein
MTTVFSHVFNSREPIWVQSFEDAAYGKLLSKPIRNITSPDGFFIAPVMWDNHCIGLFYADRLINKNNSKDKLERKDFTTFTHFTQQTNLCLSMILKKSG